MKYDKIIIGAGLYGLYSAHYCAKNNEKVLVLEFDEKPMSRATYVNQARVHNGYHYPRSYSTAIKSANYFNRFNEDFSFAINKKFNKIYATSKEYSWTSAEEFKRFCDYSNIKCEEVYSEKYFKYGMCDGVFETEEYTYDAMKIRDYYVEKLKEYPNVEIKYSTRIKNITQKNHTYEINIQDNLNYESEFILNATYASTNQVSDMLGYDLFKIKYEICEIILCKTTEDISNVGITLMDGPFFSVMPFGQTGYHSLTSVTFTPHMTSYDELPTFDCQVGNNVGCSPIQLGNCNKCINKPNSAWNYMYVLAKKYLKEGTDLFYRDSLFSMKPILMASEIDDSRPTVIKQFSSDPTFISVLSGKINTIYDLDEVLSWRTVEV
ncbi:NAD(P)/FAD-dependent oxidoreductase [Litchfieldia alkalitelluris]|uniref:NAD(P)/FAD-dependent oxidoreductase n=1 Tax=Litchfieldia alkalitelluris TaxID=304268 RepID=UPI000996A0EE|nr:NAD(P)/FAD-dependent oxidoreductase [Litchfieldia alkalitelluris]